MAAQDADCLCGLPAVESLDLAASVEKFAKEPWMLAQGELASRAARQRGRSRPEGRTERRIGTFDFGRFDYTLYAEDPPCEPVGDGLPSPESCYGVTVSVEPMLTQAALAQDTGLSSLSSSLGPTATINGANVSSRTYFGSDPANEILEWVWFKAPDELTDLWPAAEWPFDHASAYWTYLKVGYSADEPLACPPRGVVNDKDHPTFLISALMPYVAYEISQVQSIPTDDPNVPFLAGLRIRYWVGLMHHFSLFTPPAKSDQATFDLEDLPSELFEPTGTPNFVPARGTLADWWMSYVQGISVAIGWDTGGGLKSTGMIRFCEPTRNAIFRTNPAWSRYEANNGDPEPPCFSSPWAFEAIEAGGDEMTSFLGHAVWGEACVIPKPGWSQKKMVREGFERLFGERVEIEFGVDFFGPAGDTAADLGAHQVRRRFPLKASDLVDVGVVTRLIETLRSDAYGSWVFRSYDAGQLDASRAAGMVELYESCLCEEAKTGGSRCDEPGGTTGGGR